MHRLIVAYLIVLSIPLIAATRYVSHSGTNTPPYTTWETAANTIEAANSVAQPGDAIDVDSGSYYLAATVYTQPKTTLRGKGMESTRIVGSDSVPWLFVPDDSTVFRAVHLDGFDPLTSVSGTAYGMINVGGARSKSARLSRSVDSPDSVHPV